MHRRHHNITYDASIYAEKSNMKNKHGAIIVDKKGKEDFSRLE